ncbi:MAG: hypothetical protein ACRDZZ_14300 [Ilumatobacteraceae bacterium]
MSIAPGEHVGIRELARVVARAIAVELVLFEVFGRWIPTTADAAAKPVLAAASRRHAWHAEMWRARFPLIPDADADDLVTGERGRLVPFVDALAAFDAMPSGPGRLALAEVAAAELALAYEALRATIDPRLDAPTAGVLDTVLASLGATPPAPGVLTDDERAALDAFRAAAPIPTLEVT